jgi:hypothetical protein
MSSLNFRTEAMCRKEWWRVSHLPTSSTAVSLLRWNSLMTLLVEISGQKLESSQAGVFVWFSTLIFPFHRMLLMNRQEFSCFAAFFVRISKIREENDLKKNPSVDGL